MVNAIPVSVIGSNGLHSRSMGYLLKIQVYDVLYGIVPAWSVKFYPVSVLKKMGSVSKGVNYIREHDIARRCEWTTSALSLASY